ncbi:hypothetical protein CC78DRAFT_531099 [Lojkania enalia]|uniref:Uncharacterized protein n=1 Tax=Lojkania enalia TaxID=147567 RepID=A0A9P4N5G1_9PLEO|nr:hypothetical protein CC78DRAFT_531099 [Didymosphaeria enalia]
MSLWRRRAITAPCPTACPVPMPPGIARILYSSVFLALEPCDCGGARARGQEGIALSTVQGRPTVRTTRSQHQESTTAALQRVRIEADRVWGAPNPSPQPRIVWQGPQSTRAISTAGSANQCLGN